MRNLRSYVNLLFKYRLRTKKEIYERLLRKGFKKNEIENEIRKLEEEGLIDDERFARIYVRGKIERECIGRQVLIEKLLKKGVNIQTAKRIVNEEWDEEKVIANGINLYERLKRKEKDEKKILEYFLRRGIDYNLFKKIKKGLESP